MKNHWLRGVTVATVLPLRVDGTIDWNSYARLLDYCTTPEGISSVFVNGHAGESSGLNPRERAEVIHFTRKHIAPQQCLVAGLVADSIDDAVLQARQAKAAGADVLTVFPLAHPGLAGEPLVKAQLAHVRAIGEAATMPLAIFQYPFSSPATYATSTLCEFARMPWVVGVKEGSDSMTLYEDNLRALKAIKPELAVMPSNFDWFMPQLAVGGDGILSGLASLAPLSLVRLWQASERKDLDAMRRFNDALYPLVRAVYELPRSDMYARIKLALMEAGVIDCAFSRTCKTTFSEGSRAALRQGLAAARQPLTEETP
ncbi:dihydrodipicolinate synthase family protein [Caenimonas soli]|uniref:dihydrodipicolinate synthase family protein n=1 Tax=Caenimonas soli TaxID=2735555 RepID=UPI001553AD23|nr:dihydrodipicolinate synthase family protein [Caenimonas soli]NPC55968.1 dihydrodipicolinate synthase family protein [Caenimonas soli]